MNVPRRWLIILGIRGSLSEHRRKSQPSKNTKEDMGGNMSQFFCVKIVILECSPLSSKQYTRITHIHQKMELCIRPATMVAELNWQYASEALPAGCGFGSHTERMHVSLCSFIC